MQKNSDKEVIDSLSTNNALLSLENVKTNDKKIEHIQNIKDFAQEFVKNEEDINSTLKDEIINKKLNLLSLQNNVIRQLPEINMYTYKNGEDEDLNEDNVLISMHDIKELEKNIKLIGL